MLAACAGDGDLATTPTTSATTVEAPSPSPTTASPTGTPSPSETSAGDLGAADGGGEVDVTTASAALAEARSRWAANDGALYVWGYREEGEGLVDEFCVEGIVGGVASDAAACPFEATPGGRSVESWFDTIGSLLADAAATGRTASVTYDAGNGHPTSILISGGETDGLLVTSLGVDLSPGPDDETIDGDEDADGGIGLEAALLMACEGDDALACYDLGAPGEPLPPGLVTGNELTQAPDLDVLDRCGAGEPAACHEAGARGLTGD